MFPLSLHIWFEIGALFTSIICWPWIKNTKIKWFFFFLVCIVCIELTGRYYRKVLHAPNTWLYNFTIPGEYLFFACIFYLFFGKKQFKRSTLFFLFLYPIIAGINLIYAGTYYLNTTNVVIGSFGIIIFCCLFFYEIFEEEEIVSITKEPMFWIVSGLFLFCSGEFFYNLFFKLIKIQGMAQLREFSGAINHNLILVLYTSISTGLIWAAARRKFILQ
jgi:hypothetical protein